MKTVYQTEDGQTFATKPEAAEHEREAMKEWQESSIVGNWVTEVLETMDDLSLDTYMGTYRDMGKCFRDAAYALSLKKMEKYAGRSLGDVISEMIDEEAEAEAEAKTYVEITDDNSHFIRSEN